MAFKDEKWLKLHACARSNGSTYRVEILYADRYGRGLQLFKLGYKESLCRDETHGFEPFNSLNGRGPIAG